MNCSNNNVFDFPPQKRGDTFDGLSFQLLQDDEVTPVNIAGSTFLLQFRTSENAAVAYEYSTANNRIQVISGKITLIPFIVNMQPNTYVYDFQWTNSAGVVKTIIQGSWKISADISRL
jgi:hypothetical protein